MGWLLVGLAFAQEPQVVPAQEQEAVQTLGALRVSVVDEEIDLPIPGVILQLSGQALPGGVQERLTDPNGEVVFSNIPPGIYKLETSKAGFGSITLDGLQVHPGQTTQQAVKLPFAEEGTIG